MTDFVRARSEEQKQARMAEIKAAADELFCSVPYQEITLSTIAGRLSWTRANLYKYVTTKEEIYLEICSDKMQSYFDDLFAAFPDSGRVGWPLGRCLKRPPRLFPLQRYPLYDHRGPRHCIPPCQLQNKLPCTPGCLCKAHGSPSRP